jgi:hypothetical protein
VKYRPRACDWGFLSDFEVFPATQPPGYWQRVAFCALNNRGKDVVKEKKKRKRTKGPDWKAEVGKNPYRVRKELKVVEARKS